MNIDHTTLVLGILVFAYVSVFVIWPLFLMILVILDWQNQRHWARAWEYIDSLNGEGVWKGLRDDYECSIPTQVNTSWKPSPVRRLRPMLRTRRRIHWDWHTRR